MAANPTTGVDYDVDRFAIFRVSTNQYTNLNAVWPRPDGGPIQGGNPDYKYYKKVTTERPDVDHRFTVQTTSAKVDATPTPDEGHPSGTYTQIHDVTKLPVADLKLQVETEFQRQLRLRFPDTENPSVLIEVADAIVRRQNGAVLTDQQAANLANFAGVGDVVTQLRERQSALNAAIGADEDYDITEGWTTA